MAKIGIDFGTSNTSASFINPQTHRPEAILFNGSPNMPTVVFIKNQLEYKVGQAALYQLENVDMMDNHRDRDKVIHSTMLSLKRKLRQDGFFNYDGGSVSHENLVSFVLKSVKIAAEQQHLFNDPINEVTITHPVVFDQWKKELLCNAARKAGFSNVNLMEEPVAAAMGYDQSQGALGKGVLVYDFGGGTFDVAYVLKGEDGKYHVPIYPEGDPNCGGDDIDKLLYDRWEALSKNELHRGLSNDPLLTDLCFMLRCRKEKEQMCNFPEQDKFVFSNMVGIKSLSMNLRASDFDQMMQSVIMKTVNKTRVLIEKVKAQNYPLDDVILIGGSSRIPLVTSLLTEMMSGLTNLKPRQVMNTDVAVALGAVCDGSLIGHGTAYDEYCYCIYCGMKLKRNWKFCLSCGKPNFSYKE